GEYVVMVELDVILDTRLAVAAGLDDKAWLEIARHPGYALRDTDDLSAFTQRFTREQYFDAWDKRDASCLPRSMMTNYVKILRDISVKLDRQRRDKNDPFVENIEFQINVYPYSISSDVEK